MKLGAPEGAHLTYCTNIHSGETFAEVEQVLETLVPEVKSAFCPDAPFGVGLRLSAAAASSLEDPETLEKTRHCLKDKGLYVFTLNGFPYGAFHGTTVKERVYVPDWQQSERVRYTTALARVLAALLPDGVMGSISTVPGGYAARASTPDARRAIAENLVRVAAELVSIERTGGREIVLALEPEPACLLETASDAVAFFESDVFTWTSVAELARATGLATADAERALRRHLGVCLDTCHASVEFESPKEALAKLHAAGLRVPKIQLSAGLRLERPDARALAELKSFDDGVYLHQTVVQSRAGAPLQHYLDLEPAFAAAETFGEQAEWRVHFHVPIFESRFDSFSSTQADLLDLLRSAPTLAPHLEVETYTFGVLPERHRTTSVTQAIARELAWAKTALEQRP
jgi:sugar phosphate isomerase/epimerase